jgi:hypothetical protein
MNVTDKEIIAKTLAAVVACFFGGLKADLLPVQSDGLASAWGSSGIASNASMQMVGHVASSNLTSLLSHRYLVVDLSGGSSAVRFPVGWRDSDPDGGWGDEYKTTKLVLRRVSPGTFIMGEDKTNIFHRVTLSKPFFIGVFEVTQRQWKLVMGTSPSSFQDDGGKRPVETVSFDMIRGKELGAEWPKIDDVDADSFLGVLRVRTGLNFDLPTEAQWEYACSAGTETEYSYGADPDWRYMWYADNSESQTHEVGLKLPNSLKLYDMHGNVSEWCLNRNSPLWYGNNPRGYSVGSYRMKRGGSWRSDESHCSTISRERDEPSHGSPYTGFRILLGL